MDEPAVVVHVVDDDAGLRQAFSRLLTASGYGVCCHASAGDFLVAPRDPRTACMLLDLQMPGPSGIDLQAALRRDGHDMPIVFMSAYRDIPRTVLAIQGGATDFLVKPIDPPVLLAAVRNAVVLAVSRRAARAGGDAVRVPMTPRERAVLQGVVDGRLNKQLADALGVSVRTVKGDRANLMRKLGASTLAELIRLAPPHLSG